jgi:hypothetical protein
MADFRDGYALAVETIADQVWVDHRQLMAIAADPPPTLRQGLKRLGGSDQSCGQAFGGNGVSAPDVCADGA